MAKSWKTPLWLTVAIVLAGCVADEHNDAIKAATPKVLAPTAMFTALDGSKVSLASLAGKVVFIDFWAPSCMPCRRGLPFTQRLQDTFKDKGLVVLAVTTDPRDTVRAFLADNHYSFPTFMDDGSIAQQFKVDAIPHSFIIDRTGHIVHDDVGVAPQTETIKQLAAAGLDVKGFTPQDDSI